MLLELICLQHIVCSSAYLVCNNWVTSNSMDQCGPFSCKPQECLFSSRLAASEILKQPFVHFLMSPHSDVQQVIWMLKYRCCHVIGWWDICVNGQLNRWSGQWVVFKASCSNLDLWLCLTSYLAYALCLFSQIAIISAHILKIVSLD